MIRVRVPATSANLGPGFDSLGISFSMYNEYEFSLKEEGVIFKGFDEKFSNKDNIILIAMEKTFSKYDYNYGGVEIILLEQQIPISRGLGSSSSCIVAGIIGAFGLMGKSIDKDEVLKIAVDIEGHPDNVAPAILGGLVAAVMEDGEPIYNVISVKDGIKFIALIPQFTLSTKKARAVLPEQIPFKDGVYNAGRAALLVSCFANGNYKLLKQATKDKLHERYRSKLIDKYEEIYNKCFELNALGCFLSGAGPTLMAIVEETDNIFVEKISNYIEENKFNWKVHQLTTDKQGAIILEGD